MSIKLGYATVVHTIRWICGKESFRKEPKELRTKDNSVTEDTKEFFRQCAKPLTHSWRSVLNTLHEIGDYWREFKEWHKDPVGVSTRVLARHTPSIDGSIEVKEKPASINEDESLLESQYDNATPHKVPLSTFATLPSHMSLSPIGSYRPKPLSRSQSSIIQSSHHTSPWSSQNNIAPYKSRSNTKDANTSPRPLRPFPRSAYSYTNLPPGHEPSDPLTARRNYTEPILPPQATWACRVLQPQ